MFETRLKSWYYTLALDKLLKKHLWIELISKLRFELFKLEVNSNKIHNNKNKSRSNGKKSFYYFNIDSYIRVITMIYYKRIKRKELQIWIVLIQTKNQNKILSKILSTSSLISCSSYLFNLQNKTSRQENLLSKIKM